MGGGGGVGLVYWEGKRELTNGTARYLKGWVWVQLKNQARDFDRDSQHALLTDRFLPSHRCPIKNGPHVRVVIAD